MQRFTRQELASHNGQDGAPAFIAYAGKIYDVSQSFHWQGGRHWAQHLAGADLTAYLNQAPHGAAHLERVPVVGILVEE